MDQTIKQEKLRNIAVIAHVDHGKTTLIDGFLKQTNLFRQNQEEMGETRILDSNELEREKGITILAKNIAVKYKDHRINIIDTPGHSDFSGEVERTLNMADGALLVIDAQEGPMPQTEFVLKKAFELGLKIIVVINKIDKKFANISRTKKRLEDLFLKLAIEDEQLDYPIFYAVARDGKVWNDLPTENVEKLRDADFVETLTGDVRPLLDAIIESVPAPSEELKGEFQMQIVSLDFDAHLGRYLIGRINRGVLNKSDKVVVVNDKEEVIKRSTVERIYIREGLQYKEVEKAIAGDIIAIAGVDVTTIGATVCSTKNIDPLPSIKLSPPTVKVKLEPNTSPFTGLEGEFVAPKHIEQRLLAEKERNLGLTIEHTGGGSFFISGRGELQLSILFESMRREGYEFQVRRPEVIVINEDGVDKEPVEKLIVMVGEKFLGNVTSLLGNRSAEMISMENQDGDIIFEYKILTRNLIGLRNEILTDTKGTAIINSYVLDYVPITKVSDLPRNGVLISMENGTAMGYSLNTIQERGQLFITPGTEIYEGMIIGINKYEQDMVVNATKARKGSAVRMKHDEITQVSLNAPIDLTLEYALVFINSDEMVEVTPKSVRLRKILLSENERVKARRSAK